MSKAVDEHPNMAFRARPCAMPLRFRSA